MVEVILTEPKQIKLLNAKLCKSAIEHFGMLMTYLWLVGNGRMVVIVAIIVPHSSISY